MKHTSFSSLFRSGAAIAALALVSISTVSADDGKPIFNGKDLTGWHGVSEFWSVQDGCITGHTTAEHMVTENTFLIWDGGEPADFELTFKYKLTDMDGKSAKFGNSGMQYRSKIVKPEYSVLSGYQADMEWWRCHRSMIADALCVRGIQVVHILDANHSPAHPMTSPARIVDGHLTYLPLNSGAHVH